MQLGGVLQWRLMPVRLGTGMLLLALGVWLLSAWLNGRNLSDRKMS